MIRRTRRAGYKESDASLAKNKEGKRVRDGSKGTMRRSKDKEADAPGRGATRRMHWAGDKEAEVGLGTRRRTRRARD